LNTDMPAAELVFTGGPVFTADAIRSRATSVAVRGERIVAVGHDEVLDLIGAGTEVVDLAGRMLVPRFQDAHIHPVGGGLGLARCNLTAASTRAETLAALADYAESHPDDEWILGGGWSMSAFPGGTPLAADLDAIFPDRPAFLPNRDAHGAWVNTRALERAGIDASTPDPAHGRIERNADGTPSGTLHEGAMTLVSRLIPDTTAEENLDGLLRAQRHLHALGVTAWQDAIIGRYADFPDAGATYLAAASDGSLTARVVGALWWDRERGPEQIADLVERRERYRGGRFAATSVKIMQDGVAENFTASMLDPYLDACGCRTANTGISFIDAGQLRENVAALDGLGFQVHFHAIGDRAVRECLDAVQHAHEQNGRNDNRHHLAHLQVVHPDDVPRFRDLGVTANLQALWAALEPQLVGLTMPFLGEQRSGWQYPFGDLLRSGATLAAGSDWPVSSSDPLAAIHVAVNRLSAPGHEEGEYEPFLPWQSIDLASALTAYTAGSAYVNHLDDTGTIAPGKLADLAVLDRDPFAGLPEQIGTTRVLQTFVSGSRVYASADA
jgi:Predicted metal-dependent hydrolase with the TIM-barrel fold